jgi:hypothetical protein
MDVKSAELEIKKAYPEHKIYVVALGTIMNSIWCGDRIVIVHKDGIVVEASIG